MTMDDYKEQDRRKKKAEAIESLAESYVSLDGQVKLINGRLGRSEEKVEGIDQRVGEIETNELLEEGFRKGRSSMKAGTRNLIILIAIIFGSLCTAITTFLWVQRASQASLLKQMKEQVVQDKATDKDYMKERFEGIEDKLLNILTRSMKGGKDGQ